MEPFEKNETAIGMGLSREAQSGILLNRREAGEVVYGETLPEDWLGFNATLAFKNLRDEILPKANQFISHVLER